MELDHATNAQSELHQQINQLHDSRHQSEMSNKALVDELNQKVNEFELQNSDLANKLLTHQRAQKNALAQLDA